MPGALQRIHPSATAAHVAPLVVFLAFNAIPGLLRIDNSELPWFQRAPEHWVYPVQTVVVGLLLLCFRRHYRLAPWRGFGLAAVLAAVGIAVWVLPSLLGEWLRARGYPSENWYRWLGLVERREGFDPGVLSAWPAAETLAVAMRFVRMAVVVPFVEELFWRGFLMRYLVAGDRPWERVPFGVHDWRSFAIVTALVTVVHNPEDYVAAFVWGCLVYFTAVRTKSQAACVAMHAIGNLLLGVYVMKTHAWGLW